MSPERISPEVADSLADLSSARVQENAELNHPRHFWSALKNGHYRFALTGIAIAAPISAAIGVAVAAAIGGMSLFALVPAFVAAGSLMAIEGFGASGAAAASRASGLAERHARILDAESQGKGMLAASDDKLMSNGLGQHYEYPEGRDNGKAFSWKSGLTGAAVGGVLGTAIGLGMGGSIVTALEAMPALGILAAGIAAAPVTALAIAGAAAFGLFGMTFGIERHVLKSSLNQTDAIIDGKTEFTRGPDLGRAQSPESDKELAQHRMRRQTEISTLERDYNDKISWGALRGRMRGFGGVVPGVIAGAAAGAIAVAALAVTGGLAAMAPAMASLIIPVFTAVGGMLGMKVFSESSMEAGAEATARAIDNEFEHNRALRAQGITPPTPERAKEKWFNGKAMVIAGAVGAVVGAALFPVVGVGALALAHITASTSAAMAASTVIGGMFGASLGIGNKTLKAVSRPFNQLYDKTVFGRDGTDPDPVYARSRPAHQVQMSAAAPALEKVTPEDMAKIDERLSAAANDKSFVSATAPKLQVTANVHI